jgi:hypothetical protein
MDLRFLSFCNKGTYDGSDEPNQAVQYLCITDMNRIKCSTVLYGIRVSCLRDSFDVFQLYFAFAFAVTNKLWAGRVNLWILVRRS